MPDETTAGEGLSWGEMVEIQTLLISFQCGTRTRENVMLRIVDLLKDKKIAEAKVWAKVWVDMRDIIRNVDFTDTEAETQEFISYIEENYNKSQN